MKIIYDGPTQSEINRIQSRMTEIALEITPRLRDTTSINSYERKENPYYHLLYDHPEYQCLQKRLTEIYWTSVPKLILSNEEYAHLHKDLKDGDTQ